MGRDWSEEDVVEEDDRPRPRGPPLCEVVVVVVVLLLPPPPMLVELVLGVVVEWGGLVVPVRTRA